LTIAAAMSLIGISLSKISQMKYLSKTPVVTISNGSCYILTQDYLKMMSLSQAK